MNSHERPMTYSVFYRRSSAFIGGKRPIFLGNSDLQITPIGIGAWAMGGGDWAFSWGHQEDDQLIAAILAALDAGVNWIDAAAVYGLGHSKEVVGKAIAGRARRPYVFTKCSLVWNEQRDRA